MVIRRVLPVAGAVLLTVMLAACGSGDVTTATSTNPSADDSMQDANPEPPPISTPAPATRPQPTQPPRTPGNAATAEVELTAAAAPSPPPRPTRDPNAPPTATTAPEPPAAVETYEWTKISDDAPWGRRAGLRVLEYEDGLLLMGGRTPRQSNLPGDSEIFSDVWQSPDFGSTWESILATGGDHWAARAYFQAVVSPTGELMILGGQDYGLEPNPFCALLEQGLEPPPGLGIDPDAPCPEFLPTSEFFNDVWTSRDGVSWDQRTADAGWAARSGLSAITFGGHVYVMGGSTNDDVALIGANGPQRLYYNDVWRSIDGVEWEQMTDAAPWEPRAGASVVVFEGAMWLFGGEDGFTCTPLPDCEPPYFNDVWRSVDGATWELVSPAAGWSPRPGHQCEVLGPQVYCFGGFGLIENPMDGQFTANGVEWTVHDDVPWNAPDESQVKYDFDSIVIGEMNGAAVLTFGGDRETFDFADPDNWLRVDSDVWRFGPPAN